MKIMSLSDLPDDILRLISIRLNGFDNCSLWMASDSKLRQRLVNNVITDFYINYRIPGRYLWPGNFLKKLKQLSRLSLLVDPKLQRIPIENAQLFPISTLKCLELQFFNLPQLLERTGSTSSNDPTGPTTLSDTKYINLNDYYAHLEHLEIFTPWFEGVLTIDFLGCLPQNLKSLLIPRNYFKLDRSNTTTDLNKHIELLPRTLTVLEIRFDYWYRNKAFLDLSKLPPNLTSLTTAICVDDKTYHLMPKSLKKFCVTVEYNIVNLITYLPTGLENLTVDIENDPPTSQTLKRFKNLETLALQSTKDVKLDDLILDCPPKLKTFVCTKLELSNLTFPSKIFSNCLTTLLLDQVAGITPQFISSIPPSVTQLVLSQYCPTNQHFAFFKLLPKQLSLLSTHLHIIEHTSLLPNSLTSLSMMSIQPCHLSCFDRLPPRLETLTLQYNLPRSILRELPGNLKFLNLISKEIVVDDEIVASLPRGLKELWLETSDIITDAGVAHLPPSLENLYLRNVTLTDNGMRYLPITLMELNLPLNPNLTDECVKHLPRRLINLYLDEATKITSNSCKDLPKYLENLSLPKCMDWDAEVLVASRNELPQFIASVELGNEDVVAAWQKMIEE